jgi:hypothetical protein
MKKKTLMAPKRMSARPSRSRGDAQIDARSYLLRDGVRFRTVPCARFGDVQQYRLQLESDNDNIVGLDAIEDELRTAGLNLRVEAVENILNTLCGVIPEYIARTGNAIRLGNLVTLKPYATGTVAHANDAPDPEKNHLEVRATVCPALRYSLAKARLVNAMRNVDGIDSVLGGPKQNNGEVDEKNDIVVFGRNIYLPKPAGDAKVRGRAWLETREGEKLGRCEVMVSGNDNLCLRLRLDAPLRVRDCRLAIETCGTKNAALDPTSPISLYRRNVRFVGEVQ